MKKYAILCAIPLYVLLLYGWPVSRLGQDFILGRADQWGYFGPMAFYFDRALHQGDWPEWNPLLFCGTPFSANPQSAVFYPPHLLRAILDYNPTPRSALISLFLMQLAHLLAAGCGMFVLARKHLYASTPDRTIHSLDVNFAAALSVGIYLGSAAVSFCVIQHWQFTAFACWLPWLLVVLHGLAETSGQVFVRRMLLAGGLYGLAILTGFPQLVLYLSVTIAGYALFDLLLNAVETGGARPKPALRILVALGIMVLLGALLAAAILLPAAELASFSARAKDVGAATNQLNPKALDPLEAPGALLKALVFFPGSNGIRLVGTASALLALWGLLVLRRREALLWLGLFLCALDLCLGPPMPLAVLVSMIAPFNLAGPERAALFAVLPLAMLAGHGFHDLLTRENESRVLSFQHLIFLPLAAGILSATLEWSVLSPEYQTPRLVWGFALCAAALIGFWPLLRRRQLLAALLLISVAAEQFFWNATFLQFLVRQDPYRGNPEALALPAEWPLDNQRALGPAWLENTGTYTLSPAINGYDPLVIEATRKLICPPALEDRYNRRVPAEDIIAGNRRAFSLLKRRFWLLPELPPELPPNKYAAFSPASLPKLGPSGGPSEIVLPQEGIPATPAGAEVQSLHTPFFDQPASHTLLHLRWEASAPGQAVLHAGAAGTTAAAIPFAELSWSSAGLHEDTVALPDLARTTIAVFPEFAKKGNSFWLRQAARTSDPQDMSSRLQISNFAPDGVTVNVADGPEACLVFVESAYPGWFASIDGAPAKIELAFGAFQALKLPAGAHTVQFVFHSETLRSGLAISAGTLLLSLGVWGCCGLRLRGRVSRAC